jgi:hypothetical protein
VSRNAPLEALPIPRLILFSLLERSDQRGNEGNMKVIAKAKQIKSGETVFDRGSGFTVKEVRVRTDDGAIMLIDTHGVHHGFYHPYEYLGVEKVLGDKTYDWQKVEEAYLLADIPSRTIH